MSNAEAPEELADEFTVTLRRPVSFAGQTYAELKLREPTAGDLKKIADKSGTEQTVFLIFLQTGVPIGAIDLVGARDLKRAGDYLGGFFD